MEIKKILDRLYSSICAERWLYAIETDMEDIHVVTCKNQLRAFKLMYPVPEGYQPADSLEQCAQMLRKEKDYCRLLEFFVLCNPVTKLYVKNVIPEIWRNQ